MATKRRCAGCKEYFFPADMHYVGSVQAFCSSDCQYEKRPKFKRKTQDIPVKTRELVFARFKNMCAYCGRCTNDLAPHHIKYRSEGVDHSLNNLVLLCGEHHDMVHSNKNKWQPMLKEYIALVDARERPSLALMEKDWEREHELSDGS